ncbi:MAG: hypothetical protein KJ011_07120 [Burkholderiaceae bacterium]|nr:hypothetical protein [Burkholderiaceae bacterium]
MRTENQLRKAIKVRADAYGRHTPAFADALRIVEHEDIERSSLVLLGESKITGEAVGTLRIHTNFDSPTYLERILQLPEFLQGAGIAYVTRLAVANGPNGASVKLALFKALYRYCLATQISWILAVAREPVDRDFVRLGFRDILPNGEKLRRPADFGDVDVRPLYFNVLDAERDWRSSGHPLYGFMVQKVHPDIEIFASVSSAWSTPRQPGARRRPADDVLSLETAQIMAV